MHDEMSVTERLKGRVKIPRGSPVVTGIGDDCAIYRPRGSADDLLFTTDMFIEDVHFKRETHKAAAAGYKALARSLSDIAAMGGSPRLCLVSLCAAEWTTTAWVDQFYRGLLGLADATGTVLAGGDLSHGAALFCDVMVLGAVPRGSALMRSGARPGDEIYVSGKLGASSLGLERKSGAAWKLHLRPQPRLQLAAKLRERFSATSCIDLSDGLSLDLRRLCLASKVCAEIVEPPRFRDATLAQALHGGEDYELLFTLPAGTRIPSLVEGVPLSRIGSVAAGPPGLVRLNGTPLAPAGYDHFAAAGAAS